MIKTYEIIPPNIPSQRQYFFTTDKGIKYEVRFGQKRDNPLRYSVAFGVMNEKFDEEEYTETNEGEVFRVLATVIEVIKEFLHHHEHAQSLEFTGESKAGEGEDTPTIRTRLYLRYIKRYFGEEWKVQQEQNKVVMYR